MQQQYVDYTYESELAREGMRPMQTLLAALQLQHGRYY
jgi:hypothetical protein